MRLKLQLFSAALFLSAAATAWAQSSHNITSVLSSYGDYSVFNYFLLKTGVAYEINSRSSITVLAPSNKILLPVVQQHDAGVVADILRFHVLLQYFDSPELHAAKNSTITTLYQTTGRAQGDAGIVDVSLEDDGSVGVSHRNEGAKSAQILSQLAAMPYNLSVFDISSVLIPYGLAQSEISVNVTDVLVKAGSYNTLINLLQSSQLESVIQNKASSGLSLLAPNDTVFANSFFADKFGQLSSDQKTALLKYHVLPEYYPRSYFDLVSSNTYLTTFATSSSQSDYEISISSTNGQVFIGTGLVPARLAERAVYENYPVSIFSVDQVLVPREIVSSLPPAPTPAPAPPPASPDTAAPLSPPAAAPSVSPSTPPVTPIAPPLPPPASPAPVPATASPPPELASPTPAPASPPPPPPPPSSPPPPPLAPKKAPAPPPPRPAAAGPRSSAAGPSGGPSESQVGTNAAFATATINWAGLVLSSIMCFSSLLLF